LVSDNLRNHQNKIGISALNTYTIIGFGLMFLGFILFFYLATGHTTDKEQDRLHSRSLPKADPDNASKTGLPQ